jgi:integrase
MGEMTIRPPIRENDIAPLSKVFHETLPAKEDFMNISKALCLARNARYPRTKRVKYGSLQRGFSLEEFKDFLALFKPEEFRFRFYCLWSVWWGKRCGEAHQLNVSDFCFESQSIIIYREKNEGPQEFRIEDGLWAETLNYMQIYEKEIKESGGFVFFSASRTQRNRLEKCWATGWIRKKFREVCARSEKFSKAYCDTNCWHPKAVSHKLHQFSVHSLRYTFAYVAIDFFHDPTIVKELMGHRKIDSTMHYIENYRKSQTKEFSLALQKQSCLKQLL